MMRPYSEYKKTDIYWMEEVPLHWSIFPIRAIVENQVLKNENDCEDYLSLMANRGVIPYAEKGDVGNKKPEDLSKCKIVSKNDLVINSMNYSIGSYGISAYDGVCSPVYIVLKSKSNIIHPRFAFRIFENKSLQKHLSLLGNGILEHRAAIKWDQIKSEKIVIPPMEEQEKILSYLDEESKRIDTLVDEKENFIKLLKEKREALISHVVTKGLNSNVVMKDTGVEWIGCIPEHWELTKLRYLGVCQNGINIGGECFGSGFPFISYGDVYNNRTLPEKVKGLVQSTVKDRELYTVESGDVLFTRTSETIEEIGFTSVCHKTIENAVFAGFLIRFRPKINAIHANYSEYYFQNEKLRAFFVKEMNLVTRASLSQELLKRMPVPIPPLHEQKEISAYISNKTKKTNLLIDEAKRSIELLKEHRVALISAAVTGKIDIRNLV